MAAPPASVVAELDAVFATWAKAFKDAGPFPRPHLIRFALTLLPAAHHPLVGPTLRSDLEELMGLWTEDGTYAVPGQPVRTGTPALRTILGYLIDATKKVAMDTSAFDFRYLCEPHVDHPTHVSSTGVQRINMKDGGMQSHTQ